MKKERFIILVSLLVLALFLLPLITAVNPKVSKETGTDVQTLPTSPLDNHIKAPSPVNSIGEIFGLISPITWGELIIVIAIFLLFFVAFSDIIATFSAFSKPVAWVMGFGIAVVMALTKTCLMAAAWMITWTAWAGSVSVFVVLITAFIAAVCVHLGFAGIAGWVYKRQLMIKAAKGGAQATTAIKHLKEIGVELGK